AASPAVAFVDLKNEPDLDFESHGPAKIAAWLHSILALTRDAAPDLALSIGWSNADAASMLSSELDVITYHDYQPIGGAAERLSNLQSQIGDKPIYVTEIGVSTFTLAAGFPSSEDRQATRLAQRIDALSGADGVMVWTLYDFPEVDPSVVGGSPWVKRLQSSFGILRADGSEKPAAAILSTEFADKN
ncbi:MAG: glycosyl hydrolase, partial [Boseongicola sp.]|nr:glycosyl hydrolase [Boseongicola sp.]